MAAAGCFPVPNPGECFWQNEPHQLHDHRSTEQLPDHADIVIIGAGYAGASTAYHLLRDHGEKVKSITILEARGACSGATGRNGGHLRPDFYGHIPTYVDRAGVRAGAEIAEFEIANLHALKKVVEDEKIDCDLTLARSIDVWCNEEAAQKAKGTYELMKSLDLEYMNDVVFYTGKNVEGVSTNQLQNEIAHADHTDLWCQRCQSLRLLHGGHDVAVQIHPTHSPISSRYGQG